jgi:hypothetical protein
MASKTTIPSSGFISLKRQIKYSTWEQNSLTNKVPLSPCFQQAKLLKTSAGVSTYQSGGI